MSVYHRDAAGHLRCRHGVILHGDSCTRCERLRASGFWQNTAARNPIEIITDPDDPRGFDARSVSPAPGAAQWA